MRSEVAQARRDYRVMRTTGPCGESSIPAVSVIVPVYNRASLVRGTLESVQRQTIAHAVETIVVDDGSTDRTLEELMGIPWPRGRLVVISGPNGGPGAARNAGFLRSTAPYAMFLDSDDLISETKLEVQLHACARDNCDYVTCEVEIVDSGGALEDILGCDVRDEWKILPGFLQGRFFPVGCAVYTREACERAGGWPEGRENYEDWLWHIQLAIRGVRGSHVRERLLRVRRHDGTRLSASARGRSKVEEFFGYLDEVRRIAVTNKTLWLECREPLARNYLWGAVQALRRGEEKPARRMLASAREVTGAFGLRFHAAALSPLCRIGGGATLVALYDRFSENSVLKKILRKRVLG